MKIRIYNVKKTDTDTEPHWTMLARDCLTRYWTVNLNKTLTFSLVTEAKGDISMSVSGHPAEVDKRHTRRYGDYRWGFWRRKVPLLNAIWKAHLTVQSWKYLSHMQRYLRPVWFGPLLLWDLQDQHCFVLSGKTDSDSVDWDGSLYN